MTKSLKQEIIEVIPGPIYPEHAECIAEEIIKIFKTHESKNYENKIHQGVRKQVWTNVPPCDNV